jgi:hypothetical protein
MRKSYSIIALALMPIMITLGCGELGKVDQGRVVQFDKNKKMVTLIRDKKIDPQNPDYSSLPPITYTLPADPQETGPDPKAGLRMKLDVKNNQIIIFDPGVQNFKTIPFTLVDQKEKIENDNPLVFDKNKDKPIKFPVIDKEKKTVTIYSKRQQTLITFSIPEEYFALPDYTWDSGDEVRIYYKEEGKARRFMNVTKTDIYKK